MNTYSTAIATSLLLCASCSSDDAAVSPDNTNLSNTSYSQYGVFALRRNSGTIFDSLSTFEGAFANFFENEEMVTSDDVLSDYRLPLDTCVTFQQPNDAIGNGGLIPNYDQSVNSIPTYLSAGEVLSLMSSNGSWIDIDRGQAPYYEYANINLINQPLPSSLKLNIPGDSFPEYTDVPIPDVETITLTSPNEGTILQLDTKFTWVPGVHNNAYLRITAEKNIGSERAHLDCMAEDDGEFQIPDSVQMELGDLFKDYAVRVNRTVYSTQTNGDSLLIIFHSVGSE